MKATLVNVLTAGGCLLLLFVAPLQSDPQGSYWPNYDFYDHRLSANPAAQFPGPNIPRPSTPTRYNYSPKYLPKYLPNYSAHSWNPQKYNYPINDQSRETRYVSPQDKYYMDFLRYNEGQLKSEEEKMKFQDVNESGNSGGDEEIIEKMNILDRYLSDDSREKDLETNFIDDKFIPEETKRVVRQVRKQRPGFFWTLARVTFETINDTRSAIKQISEIINNGIAPDSATQSSMPRGSLTVVNATTNPVNATETATTPTTTTTEEPFVITRSGLQSIIRRNILGLVRLFNIEWKDAVNQSELNVKQFQKDLGNQIGSYLQDNPEAY